MGVPDAQGRGAARRGAIADDPGRRRATAVGGRVRHDSAGGNHAASAAAGMPWTALSPDVAFVYLAGWMLLALAGLVAASGADR